jgi:hypothetical protein
MVMNVNAMPATISASTNPQAALAIFMKRPFQHSKKFFFEKKNQKTFAPGPMTVTPPRSRLIKAFCCFFAKKPCFLA